MCCLRCRSRSAADSTFAQVSEYASRSRTRLLEHLRCCSICFGTARTESSGEVGDETSLGQSYRAVPRGGWVSAISARPFADEDGECERRQGAPGNGVPDLGQVRGMP